MSWTMDGSISRRKTKPPGKVCARAGTEHAMIARVITIAFMKAVPTSSWPDFRLRQGFGGPAPRTRRSISVDGCSGHPRPCLRLGEQDVDGRDKTGHDEAANFSDA